MHRRCIAGPAEPGEDADRQNAPAPGSFAAVCATGALLVLTLLLPLASAQSCLVIDVSDGDALTVRCGEPGSHAQAKVKVAAISAPERNRPYSTVARTELAGLCFRYAAEIREIGRDSDGRIVAHVSCRNIDVGKHLVGRGLARIDGAHADGRDDLHLLQDNARAKGYGLWSDLASAASWEWRHDRCALPFSLKRCKGSGTPD